jgi:hypothetical protein
VARFFYSIGTNIPNDEITGLGAEIWRIIRALGGKKTNPLPQEVYWPTPDDELPIAIKDQYFQSIGKYELPQTATQYEIDIDQLSQLYSKLLQL